MYSDSFFNHHHSRPIVHIATSIREESRHGLWAHEESIHCDFCVSPKNSAQLAACCWSETNQEGQWAALILCSYRTSKRRHKGLTQSNGTTRCPLKYNACRCCCRCFSLEVYTGRSSKYNGMAIGAIALSGESSSHDTALVMLIVFRGEETGSEVLRWVWN